MPKTRQLEYREIESRLEMLKGEIIEASEVGYAILHAFGKSEREINRYKEGKGILKTFDGLLIKGEFCYQKATTEKLTDSLHTLTKDPKVRKAAPKIVAVSDGNTVVAYDLREHETYERNLKTMYSDFTFFYPLMGVERVHNEEENPADVKAAEKLAKLHDELRAYNSFDSDNDLHDLNIFITRLLFCFFAEDTGIFVPNLFSDSIERFTHPDGTDISQYLDHAFNIMDTQLRSDNVPKIITQFPYVNGGLFAKRIHIPRMGRKARRLILECGDLNWKDINPDIFGSMIQAVVNPEIRAKEGMHYTSVPNIMKVINPLFLDELRSEYNRLNDKYKQQRQLLEMGGTTQKTFADSCRPIVRQSNALLQRMSHMKFFDPACGSGNFLIITYKSLRLLEIDILHLIEHCNLDQQTIEFSGGSIIRLNQFYGIELLDFPHEVAMLSLWLAEHQMDNKFFENFRINTEALPLHNITQIHCGNACRMDWNTICPHEKDEEVFVFGNPPYLGSKLQDKEQKKDISLTFGKTKNSKILDYISIWFYLGAKFIEGSKGKFAFVSTNSICQGEQVAVLWNEIFNMNEEISFAYTSFKWTNNAKYNAAVTVIIVGVQNCSNKTKILFAGEKRLETKNISPYLSAGSNVIVKKKTSDPDGLPKLCFGCMPYDDRNHKYLRLDTYEKEELLKEYPQAEPLIRRIYGAEEFINEKLQYCLWISDAQLPLANSIPPIKKRIEANRNFRLNESVDGQELAERPHQFREHPTDGEKIIIPRVSSEKREYIPMDILKEDEIISDSAFALYDAPIWLFGILTSRMHMTWVRTVGGRLETRYRYSAQLCYNTFPFPSVSSEVKAAIEQAAEDVLITRANHPRLTLADLYDSDRMPDDLRQAHTQLDDLVERCYNGYPFASDEARLECLFKLYEKMNKE